MPLLGELNHRHITKSLQTRVPELLRLNTPDTPRVIIVVTAHWSTENPTISSGKQHSLYYDYYNFPPETYKLKYDAPGSPEVAEEIAQAMREVGLKPELDAERGTVLLIIARNNKTLTSITGWDHGVFVPMLLINSAANIPIVQVSVLESESPAQHILMGRALSHLRESNIAIIASGFASFHNLRILYSIRSGTGQDADFFKRNKEWSKAVSQAVSEEDREKRDQELKRWREWPAAYEMHPKGGAEHFLPLIVAAGAGEGRAEHYTDEFMGLEMFSYFWK